MLMLMAALNGGVRCINGLRYAVCADGMKCDTDNICRIKLNYGCPNPRLCVLNAFCDNGKCKLKKGESCNPTENGCSRGYMCDPNAHRCLPKPFAPCTRGQSDCGWQATCDSLSICRKKVGEFCKQSTECVAGGHCVQRICACNEEVSTQDGHECKAKTGRITTACSVNTDCLSKVCKDNVCACGPKTAPYSVDLTCKPNAGSTCTSDSDCNTGLICEQGKCKVRMGQDCHNIEEYCQTGSTCHESVCKIQTSHSCKGHEDVCVSGNVCSGGVCKTQMGADCQNAQDSCVTGICSAGDNHTCRTDAGQSCTSGNEQEILCRAGTTCHTGVCKIGLGSQCANATLCPRGAVCESKPSSSDKKCRKPLGAEGCKRDEDCAGTTVCDHRHQCRLGKGKDCVSQPSACLLGASCTDGTCQCNSEVTQANSPKCEPKARQVGGSCSASQPCQDPAAECRDNVCQCGGTLTIDPVYLSCVVSVGLSCSDNDTSSNTPCITGATCEKGTCVLGAGEVCSGNHRGLCKLGTFCDVDNFCRLSLHQNCSGHTTYCTHGAVCDPLQRCKYGPGAFCRHSRECMAGAHCYNATCNCTEGISTMKDGTCEANEGRVGGSCGAGKCSDSVASCSQTTSRCECPPGHTADPKKLNCVKVVGGSCSEDTECMTETICDSVSSKCKMDLKGNCSGDNYAFCKSGMYCDWLGQCSNGLNEACNLTQTGDTCIAGATCNNSVCTCDPDISTAAGALCEPLSGRYGGSCSIHGSKCDVDYSVCEDGTCACTAGFKPNRKFDCESGAQSRGGGLSKKAFIGMVTVLALLCLLVLVGCGVIVRRHVHKKRGWRSGRACSS